MGGSGAKERRQLQRLQKQQEETTTKISDNNPDVVSKSRTVTSRDALVAAPRRNNHEINKKRMSQSKTRNVSSSDGNTSIKNAKKAKTFQKPKHLKRKLETACDNNTAREMIQEELEKFMAVKKQRLQQKQHTIQRNDTKTSATTKDALSKPPPSKPRTEMQSQDARGEEGTLERRCMEEEQAFPRIGSRNKNDKAKSSSDDGVVTEESANKKNRSESSSSKAFYLCKKTQDCNTTDDTDNDENNPTKNNPEKRSRGRRGRGRQGMNTSDIVEEQERKILKKQDHDHRSDEQTSDPTPKEDVDTKISNGDDTAATTEQGSTRKKKDENDKKNDGRYCIGRKPCTDFVVGKSYRAKVVYVKPFGIFLDIGCHSDAFCHVSRLSDDYIEHPHDHFKEGDEIPSVRIVEVDRHNKRLTVSLQSEARIVDEKASIEARLKRKEKLLSKKKSKTSHQSRVGGHSQDVDDGRSSPFNSTTKNRAPLCERAEDDNKKKVGRFSSPERHAKSNPSHKSTATPTSKPESEMTHAELKRARKLERRAARREVVSTVAGK